LVVVDLPRQEHVLLVALLAIALALLNFLVVTVVFNVAAVVALVDLQALALADLTVR
jgi:hypothetical protein